MKYTAFTFVESLALKKYQLEKNLNNIEMAQLLDLSEHQLKRLRTCKGGISKTALKKFEILLQEAGW
ncbi:MAG: hypothetical protein NE330_15075 [Lentisphaeraceae bacterium]|nr:hypothetical protein [Lentisphaeraceae bacterium]